MAATSERQKRSTNSSEANTRVETDCKPALSTSRSDIMAKESRTSSIAWHGRMPRNASMARSAGHTVASP
eukprot:4390267-Alexandrium_andersonii.AAC.1